MQRLRPLRSGVFPAQRGAAGTRLVGRGPVRVGSMAGVGPFPLLALPVRPVCLPFLLLSPRIQKRGLVRYLFPSLDDLASVVTAQRLAVTAPLSLAPRDWVRVNGLRRVLTGLTQSIAVVLPPLLWVWWTTTVIVPPVWSIWIRMIRFGLFFALSGSSIA